MKGYNIYSILILISSLIYTKLFHRQARLIRLPTSIRNSGSIVFGENFTSGRYCRIDAISHINNQIVFGNNCQINDSVHIASAEKVRIGNNVLIASRVFITDHNHGSYSGTDCDFPDSIAAERKLRTSPVEIHDNVWLGEGVVVLPGVTIGKNSIIGANSVVSKDMPANSICCGSPAKVIKVFDYSTSKWVRI